MLETVAAIEAEELVDKAMKFATKVIAMCDLMWTPRRDGGYGGFWGS